MLQTARRAPHLLGESTDLVRRFLHSQMNADGGFRDRAGQSDVYYTVFGLQGLIALDADVPLGPVAEYLASLGSGTQFDLVHAASLARCWAALPPAEKAGMPRAELLRHLATFRSDDGAYDIATGSTHGTLYGCFLALGAYEDLDADLPEPAALVTCVERLRTDDGGYANGTDLPVGLVPTTAAAVALLRNLGRPVPPEVGTWLLAQHCAGGGFLATPAAPMPDLLSTATALFALHSLHADLAAVREPCLDFINSLWTNRGAFCGNWADDVVDCEYTYYALLALGCLSQ
jgi:hypothetical protein